MRIYHKSPFGIIELEEIDGAITLLRFVNRKSPQLGSSPLLDEAVKQLDEYFAGQRKAFDIPTLQSGTELQELAWAYLPTIPYGKTVSYKEQAKAIDREAAVRPIGSANGRNNIAIIIPCHRVVKTDGGLGGYAYGLEIKQQLLDLEQKYK